MRTVLEQVRAAERWTTGRARTPASNMVGEIGRHATTVATMDFPVPGGVKLVDHALSRVARKGCMAVVAAEGEEKPGIFDPEPNA